MSIGTVFDKFNKDMADEEVRKEQREFHREQRKPLTTKKKTVIKVNPPAKKKAPVGTGDGHDRLLSALQKNKAKATFYLVDVENPITGIITARDKWTITIDVGNESDLWLIYKSALSCIRFPKPKKADNA